MTLIDPIRTPRVPLTGLELGYTPFPNVQPFSPRTASGYQETLEGIVRYLTRTIYPYLAATNPQEVWDGNVDLLLAAVDTALAAQSADVDADLAGKLADLSLSSTDAGIAVVVSDTSTDYAPAIQEALDTGQDVYVVGTGIGQAQARIKATLTMNPNAIGQRFETRHVALCPDFVGDCVQVTTTSAVRVAISGDFQPAAGGNDLDTAAIRIGRRPGSPNHWDPQQASVANSIIRGYRGSGIIWEDGAMIDFSHVAVYNATQDGIRAVASTTDGTVNGDNNHGWFANTHVVNCGGVGYRIDGNGANLDNGGSRHHVFADAKAFGCEKNFQIASRSNAGVIFSELSTNPSELTSASRGNRLDIVETAASFEGWADNGIGNSVSGYSGNNAWETKYSRVRTLEIGAVGKSTAYDQAVKGTLAVNQAIAAGATVTVSTTRAIGGDQFTVELGLFTADPANYQITPVFGADGTLSFVITNNGTARTLAGNINYVVKRFV